MHKNHSTQKNTKKLIPIINFPLRQACTTPHVILQQQQQHNRTPPYPPISSPTPNKPLMKVDPTPHTPLHLFALQVIPPNNPSTTTHPPPPTNKTSLSSDPVDVGPNCEAKSKRKKVGWGKQRTKERKKRGAESFPCNIDKRAERGKGRRSRRKDQRVG